MAVILLNLLIAIMSDKHSEVKKQERASANYNRAGIVVEYEKLMSAEERKRPEYSPTYLQVLRPEKVIDNADSAEEIRELNQLVHDKTDALREDLKELKEENADLKKELKEENADLINELKEENADLKKELKEENADLRKELKQEIANLKKQHKEENANLIKELKELIDMIVNKQELEGMTAKELK